ncbi:TRANSPARENT TESTA 9-like protein [Drosera capensis]
MWFSFWRSKNRFTLDELRYLTDQLQKVQSVHEINKGFIIEALRLIAELITYGDQHDSAFFDFFMEKQVMGEFIRILKLSTTVSVSLQLLQTTSIMIQNLKNERAIYYLFSNEHINYLITYSFDFRNEELLSYYISFLRAISGKLDKSTISLLVKAENDSLMSFPLYVEAIRFAFHEESMIRIAVRSITLNIYHVGDESVNRFVTTRSLANYFRDLVSFLRKQCTDLSDLVHQASKNPSEELSSGIAAAVDEIEDNLYYFSDVISAGIPDVGKLITDNLLQLLILPLLLPCMTDEPVNVGFCVQDIKFCAVTSLYLLCCILRMVKIKDLANTIAAALFCPRVAFLAVSEVKTNGCFASSSVRNEYETNHCSNGDFRNMKVTIPEDTSLPGGADGSALREVLLSYLISGSDELVLGSLVLLATLLQTKELDESMLDALGILPQRKQHKKLLLQALVGESSGEDQLFSLGSSSVRESFGGDFESYLHKLKDQYGISCSVFEAKSSPRLCRHQVLDALVRLFSRLDVSAEALWDGGWLLRQLLPHNVADVNRQHLQLLRERFNSCCHGVLEEAKGFWPDVLLTVITDEWKRSKKAVEASSPRRELKDIVIPSNKSRHRDFIPNDSSFAAGENMCELVKVFVLLCQLQMFFYGKPLPDQPPFSEPSLMPKNSRAEAAGLVDIVPKPGVEVKLFHTIPCIIAFEKGKERHFRFLAFSLGTSGWLVLGEDLPVGRELGVVRVVAPLAGCNPRVDDRHLRWLHLRIRPSSLPSFENLSSTARARGKAKSMVDGRWTLAFKDEESCRSALSMVLDEINLQSLEVGSRLKPLLDLSSPHDLPGKPEAEGSTLNR